MATDPRTLRVFFRQRLSQLRDEVPAIRLAAIASEDGLLSATDADDNPQPLDRRTAALAALVAVARTTARELQLDEAWNTRIDCGTGALLARPFGQRRRRLLVLVLDDATEVAQAYTGAAALIADIEARLEPGGGQLAS